MEQQPTYLKPEAKYDRSGRKLAGCEKRGCKNFRFFKIVFIYLQLSNLYERFENLGKLKTFA